MALPGVGMSILEISHRSKTFEAVIQEAEANLRSLLGIPDHYKVLFLQGGATLQFSMVPINFLRGSSADYILTGTWGQKAIAEAKREGSPRVAWSNKEEYFIRTPHAGEVQIDPQAAYVHMTSNETIQGVQFPETPDSGGKPLICDSSSDFMCRPLPLDKYAMIYAGAQKNAGPAGATMVIIRDDLLERVPENMHSMLDYRLQAENDSLYNTPPVFSIYIVMLVTRWLRDEMGGLEKMHAHNQQKASFLYDTIDESGGFYRGHAVKECRSLMNVTWRLPTEELEAEFVKQAKAEGMHELKGHRSVGGIRASIYNAMPIEGVQTLQAFMKEFQRKMG